jgi:hypothetical protein
MDPEVVASKAWPELARLACDKSQQVRQAAAESLAALTKLIKKKDRKECVGKVLEGLLGDPVLSVRLASVQSLGQLAPSL